MHATIDNRATNRDWKQHVESSFRSRDLTHTALVDDCAGAAVMCVSSFPECQVVSGRLLLRWRDIHES